MMEEEGEKNLISSSEMQKGRDGEGERKERETDHLVSSPSPSPFLFFSPPSPQVRCSSGELGLNSTLLHAA